MMDSLFAPLALFALFTATIYHVFTPFFSRPAIAPADDASRASVTLESEKVVLKIMINPLVQMVWTGGIIMALGTIITIRPSRTDRKLKEQLS